MFRFLSRGPRTVRVPIDRRNIEVQSVKVTQQPRPLVARFILTCIVTSLVIQGVKRWDPLGTYASRDVLQDELERVKRATQQEEGDKYGQHWDRQHSQFTGSSSIAFPSDPTKLSAVRITVPIWLRKGHQRMYTEKDPEWREFAKLQGDAKRIDQIRRQIGESVMHQIKDHGRNKFELALIRFNGKIGVALEIVPQVFTPPIYEVPCIWLSTNSMSTGWRPLPPQTGARMERVFRPVVLLEASTAAIKTFFIMTYAVTKAKVMGALGKEENGGPKSVIVVPRTPTQPPHPNDSISAADSKSKKPIFPLFPDLGNSDAMRKIHGDVVGSVPYSSAIQHAAFAFDQVRNARQRLAVSTNVKGVCQVRGYLTFFGDRGRFRLEVVAYYLPADNVFVGAVNVRSGYVVQDYRAWEKLIEKEKRQKEQQALEDGSISKADPDIAKSTDNTTSSLSTDDKEKNK